MLFHDVYMIMGSLAKKKCKLHEKDKIVINYINELAMTSSSNIKYLLYYLNICEIWRVVLTKEGEKTHTKTKRTQS